VRPLLQAAGRRFESCTVRQVFPSGSFKAEDSGRLKILMRRNPLAELSLKDIT
jgi:hypothetical protein